MTNCIIYARFSPRPNAEQTNTIERQIEMCSEYAISKGYTIQGAFEDRGKSRHDIKRPGIIEAIDTLKRGWVLITYNSSRFGSGNAAVMLEHQIKHKKARLEFADGSVYEDTKEQRFFRTVMYAVDELKREEIAARSKYRMQKLQASGHIVSKNPPYGFTRDPENPKRWKRHPDEYKGLQAMLELHKEGMSLSAIAREMEKRGHPRRGSKWHHVTVRRSLVREGVIKNKKS